MACSRLCGKWCGGDSISSEEENDGFEMNTRQDSGGSKTEQGASQQHQPKKLSPSQEKDASFEKNVVEDSGGSVTDQETSQQQSKKLSPSQLKDEETWNLLATQINDGLKKLDYYDKPVKVRRNGSIVVVGSGIKCTAQFTQEAISHIKNADKVLYCVADPATEVYIRQLCPDNALDLYVFYADDKKRYDTYVQMAESCLYFARQGLDVVAVYYGHPGVFVLPSHRAIQIAKRQGIRAYMLPGISAQDSLFADLGIDPSYPGLQTLEATDLLLRNRTVLTYMHVIIWQVGCVGDIGFRRKGYINENFHILVKRLQSIYGDDYEITHYVGAQYPVSQSVIEQIPLNTLLEPATAKRVSGISTFYVPPKDDRNVDAEMAVKLGISKSVEEANTIPSNRIRKVDLYGVREKSAIQELHDWTVPNPYTHTPSTNTAGYLVKLSHDIPSLKYHKKYPAKSTSQYNLPVDEAAHVNSGISGRIRFAMKPPANNYIAWQVVNRMITEPAFTEAFASEARSLIGDPDVSDKLHDWLVQQGYNVTSEDVIAVTSGLQFRDLLIWGGIYNTDKDLTLLINGREPSVLLDSRLKTERIIQGATFNDKTLAWSSEKGNPDNAEITFEIKKPTNDDESVCIFTGKYWKNDEMKPSADNIKGHNLPTSNVPSYIAQHPDKVHLALGTVPVLLTQGLIQAQLDFGSILQAYNQTESESTLEVLYYSAECDVHEYAVQLDDLEAIMTDKGLYDKTHRASLPKYSLIVTDTNQPTNSADTPESTGGVNNQPPTITVVQYNPDPSMVVEVVEVDPGNSQTVVVIEPTLSVVVEAATSN